MLDCPDDYWILFVIIETMLHDFPGDIFIYENSDKFSDCKLF